jgi:hypothetical protein
MVNFSQTTRRYNPEDSHLHIKVDLKEIECVLTEFSRLQTGTDGASCEHGNELSGSIKG